MRLKGRGEKRAWLSPRHLGEKIRESEGLGREAARAEPVGPADQQQVGNSAGTAHGTRWDT